MEKTNVMRLLDGKKINYKSYEYPHENGAVSGSLVAEMLGLEESRVFKTLVTKGALNKNYVFVVPVAKELNLKKAAKSVGEKSIEMIKSKELLPLTGYVHGGCSPIGMKKFFRTTVDLSANDAESIIFSAGKIGYQVEISTEDLKRMIKFEFADVAD